MRVGLPRGRHRTLGPGRLSRVYFYNPRCSFVLGSVGPMISPLFLSLVWGRDVSGSAGNCFCLLRPLGGRCEKLAFRSARILRPLLPARVFFIFVCARVFGRYSVRRAFIYWGSRVPIGCALAIFF